MKTKILLGTKVKEIAKEKKIPLCVVEKEAGIASGSISKWDEITPSFDKVCRVAKILKVNVNKLVPKEPD